MSPRPTSTPARRLATLATLGTAALTLLAAACADAPSAPAASTAATSLAPSALPAYGKHDGPRVVVDALTRNKPLEETLSDVAVIGPKGGTLEIKETGLKVTFPKGLVDAPTRFWVKALPGNIIAYDFGPSSDFGDQEVIIEQKLKGTSFESVKNVDAVKGAYFRDAAALNDGEGFAEVTELRPASVTFDKDRVRFGVTHFSGYMVSTGRRR
ncbi:MAG: hypothetical protein ACXW05_18835 [Gemmatirosa sp.]